MASSKDLLAAPPVASAGGTITYLGVPKGYIAQRPDIQGPVGPNPGQDPTQVKPRYEEGAQYDPNGYSPEIRAQMQTQMDAAGLFDKGDRIKIGVWDDTSVAAYTKLLQFANQGGRSVPEALKELGTLSAAERAERGLGGVGQAGAGGKSARNPLVVSLSNPQDLRTLVDRTARKTLGRAPSEKEMTTFVSAYQQMQAQQQQAEYAATETGGTVVAAPDPSVFAEKQAEAMDPVAAEAARQVSVMKTISGALSGMRGA